jgi:hypothetical protein
MKNVIRNMVVGLVAAQPDSLKRLLPAVIKIDVEGAEFSSVGYKTFVTGTRGHEAFCVAVLNPVEATKDA